MNPNKNIKLRKIGHRGPLTIWLVNGSEIRKNIDKDFTNFGQHFRFPFIPVNEFWLDREAVPNERQFFIDHLLVEWKLMAAGYSYFYALSKGNKAERSERKKAGIVPPKRKQHGAVALSVIHKKKLGMAGNLQVWQVDGRFVRSTYDIEFTEGGHQLVYRYVRKNEVWIDDDVMTTEKPYIILHELFERSQMDLGLSYPRAHAKASLIEWKARHHEKVLHRTLKQLNWQPIK